jgi:hypothetical protein
MLERLRIKGAETDKALREAQKRYSEQVCTFCIAGSRISENTTFG